MRNRTAISTIMVAVVVMVASSIAAHAIQNITVRFGKREPTTDNIWNCVDGPGMCSLMSPTLALSQGAGRPNATALVQSNQLVITFTQAIPAAALKTKGRDRILSVNLDLALDPDTAKLLGLRGITIAKGDYTVDYSKNRNGVVKLKLKTDTTRK